MNTSSDIIIRKFNPGTFQSDEEIIKQFVVREREFGIVLDTLRGNIDSESCQHTLIIAPRGGGKTMLLARIAAELNADNEFSERLLPVRFMEESHEIFELADFWLETLFYLSRESARHDPQLATELQEAYDDLVKRWGEETLANHVRATVLDAADRLDRKLVLMIENMQSLCENVDDDFGWQLRGALQSEPQIILLATATNRFRELDDAQQPFFELLQTINLKPLNTDECRRLWHVVSGDEAVGREIRPLEILTGGSPRLLAIIAGFAQRRSLHQLMEDLVQLIDDHTEYFRGHLEALAKTERRVYLAAIDLWQPSSTGEIAARARMDVRSVSALLGRLVDRGMVIVKKSGNKRFYAASERLYSIYYKLRRKQDEADIVRELIHFMAVFYSRTELSEMSSEMIAEAKRYSKIQRGLERAIAERPDIADLFPGITEPRTDRVSVPDIEDDNECIQRLLEEIAAMLQRAKKHEGDGDFAKAITVYDQLIMRCSPSDAPYLQTQIAWALLYKGDAHMELEDFMSAMMTYEELIEHFGDSNQSECLYSVYWALLKKGIIQEQSGDWEDALVTYNNIITFSDNIDESGFEIQVAWALLHKGYVHRNIGFFDEALAVYDEIVERFGDSNNPDFQVQVIRALSQKGNTYRELDNFDEALSVYDEIVERFGDSNNPDFHVQVIRALSQKGDTCRKLGNFDAAFSIYDSVIERLETSANQELREQIAWTLLHKGDMQKEIGNFTEALAVYNEIVERFGDSNNPDFQVQVIWALSQKGNTYRELGNFDAAFSIYDSVIERLETSANQELREQIAWTLLHKGDMQREIGNFTEALATYEKLILYFGADDTPEYLYLIFWALSNKGGVQTHLGDLKGALVTYEKAIARFSDSKDIDLQVKVAWTLFENGHVHRQLGDFRSSIAACDEIIMRFGDNDAEEFQIPVVCALFEKGMNQLKMRHTEAMLRTYAEFVRRSSTLSDVSRAGCAVRTILLHPQSLPIQNSSEIGADILRFVCMFFVPGQIVLLKVMQNIVLDLVAAGAPVQDILDVLLSDIMKDNALTPLIIALRQHAGEEAVRAPLEILEMAADIRERMKLPSSIEVLIAYIKGPLDPNKECFTNSKDNILAWARELGAVEDCVRCHNEPIIDTTSFQERIIEYYDVPEERYLDDMLDAFASLPNLGIDTDSLCCNRCDRD